MKTTEKLLRQGHNQLTKDIEWLKGVLRKVQSRHNLLRHIADGKCQCDPEVGAVPCLSCAAEEILNLIDKTLKQS